MGQRLGKSKPTWADVKTSLARFDRAGLLGLLQDLYVADEGNRAFLHARFGLGKDPRQPYKKMVDRWLWPDIFRGQRTSVFRAQEAIAKYEKAIGDPVGLAELRVFYCERAAGFCQELDHRESVYLDALVRMFGQALKAVANVTRKGQNRFLFRLDYVRNIGRQLENGVGEEMDVLLSEFESNTYPRSVPWKGK